MARWKGTVTGRTSASRLGDDDSGITVEAIAQDLGIRVRGERVFGEVRLAVYATTGRARDGAKEVLLGRLRRELDGTLSFERPTTVLIDTPKGA